jgi:hypothetical protein
VEFGGGALGILAAKYGAGDFENTIAVFVFSSNTDQTLLKLLMPYLYYREIPGRRF